MDADRIHIFEYWYRPMSGKKSILTDLFAFKEIARYLLG